MTFEVDLHGLPLPGDLKYQSADNAFDFFPSPDVAISDQEAVASIALGTLQLEVRIHDGRILFVWGYAPRGSWNEGSLPTPDLTPGALYVTGTSLTPGVSVRFAPAEDWTFTRDPDTGWVYFGESTKATRGIEVAAGVGAVVTEGYLRGIWLHPSMTPA